MSQILEDIAGGAATALPDILARLLLEHAQTALAYENFRALKASCWAAAQDAAGEKPVTETYLERAVIAAHGVGELEAGKTTFHRLEALSTQIQGYSALLEFDATRPEIIGTELRMAPPL